MEDSRQKNGTEESQDSAETHESERMKYFRRRKEKELARRSRNRRIGRAVLTAAIVAAVCFAAVRIAAHFGSARGQDAVRIGRGSAGNAAAEPESGQAAASAAVTDRASGAGEPVSAAESAEKTSGAQTAASAAAGSADSTADAADIADSGSKAGMAEAGSESETDAADDLGSEAETDDALRERAFEAPERFSTAGPSGAYEYHTKSANASIDDVCVWSPSPGVVQVCFLLAGGIVPEAEMLGIVDKALSAKDVRPLTDKVEVVAPAVVPYDIDVSYYIDGDADAATTQKNVAAAVQAYVAWQGARLNRDIDPSELVRRIKAVSGTRHVVVKSPAYTSVGRDSNKLNPEQRVEVAQANAVSVRMTGRED